MATKQDEKLDVCFGSTANVASGGIAHSQPLFSVRSAGLTANLSLFYNSVDPYRGPLGRGWTHTYDIAVTEDSDGRVVLREPGGARRMYYPRSGGGYNAPDRDYSMLVKNSDGAFTLTHKDGAIYNFNVSGNIAAIVDRNGNALTFTYTSGNLTAIIDPAGRITTLSYDGNNRLTTITDPAGHTYQFTVTGTVLTSVAYPEGGTWNYTYDAAGYMLTKQDPLGNTTNYSYDMNHRVLSATVPEGKTRALAFATDGGVGTWKTTSFTEMDGGVWTYTYDISDGHLYKKTDPSGNTTSYYYDPAGNMQYLTDPNDNTTAYNHDSQGNIISVWDALGNTTSYDYNNFGQVTSVTDPLGNTTTLSYDVHGNLVSITDPAGGTTMFEYDSRGNMVKVTNALGNISTYAYDQADNLVSTTDPLGAVTTFTYDVMGNILSSTDATGKTTTFLYDVMGRLLRITDPRENATNYTYDAGGNLATVTDANSRATTYQYNYRGQVTSATDALGNVTTYTYGGTGCSSCGGGGDRLVAVTDPKGQKTAFKYDLLGRLVKETDPLGKVTSYAYDANGNLISRTDAKGNVIIYSYDDLNRLLGKTYPDSTGTTFTYDARGNMQTAANQNISYTYSYDSVGRVTAAANSWSMNISYQYDALGRPTRVSTSVGTVDYQYDAVNRLTQVASAGKGVSFTYDASGRKTGASYPNALANDYVYDPAGRLTLNQLKDSVGVSKAYDRYTYDNVGNRASAKKYDSQVDPVADKALLTKNGAIMSHRHNDANQVTAAGRMTFTYDNNGSMLTKTDADASLNVSYTYDYEGRLVRADKNEGGVIATSSYTYDPFGRRLTKTVYENSALTRDVRYVYDREDMLVENRSDLEPGAVQGYVLNLHGPGIDEPVAYTNSGQMYFYHADGLGSIKLITDESGTVTRRYNYDAYGNITATITDRPFTYTGREYDAETGLYYYRARYYDPVIGRFTQKDPIGFAGGDVNLYAYVGGNPVNYIDPKGLETEVTVWQPVGWGQSSFGHVTVNINGTTYSYSPSGMNIIPTENYLKSNSFREGVGAVLDITAEQETVLNNFLKNYNKGYGIFTGNCADPIESGLEKLGYDMGLILFPVSLGNKLQDLGIVNKFNFYSATQPKKGTSAPWAR